MSNFVKQLKFVQGSVSRKELVPSLTHFKIENGEVRGFNGSLAINCPIPFDIDCSPRAEQLIKAIQNCEDTIQMTMTPSGRLSIKSGGFKAFVDCVEGETAHVMPEGDHIDVDGEALLAALKVLAPFIGDDASRPWCNGVLLDGQSAFATNNIVVIEYWIGATFPHRVNVPRNAIKEMLRVGEAPIGMQYTDNSLTFHYTEGRWIRSQLLNTDWPNIRELLDKKMDTEPVHPELFVGLRTIKPFADKLGRVIFTANGIKTHYDEGEGAAYEIEGFGQDAVFALEKLQLLEGVVQSICWAGYPGPCLFYGDRVRGAIIGMRL